MLPAKAPRSSIGGGLDYFMTAVVSDRQRRASIFDGRHGNRASRLSPDAAASEDVAERHRRPTRFFLPTGRRTRPAADTI